MVLMLLLLAPASADTIVHASVSTGWQCLPALRPELSNTGAIGFSRIEVGAGPELLQFYGVFQTALHNGQNYYYSSETGGAGVVGDTRFTNAGVGMRMPLAFGVFRLAPHADLGGAFADAPMNKEFYQTDVVAELGMEPAVGIHSAGLWAQAGADAGVTILEDAMDIFLAADGGVMTTGGFQPVLDLRIGLSGRF